MKWLLLLMKLSHCNLTIKYILYEPGYSSRQIFDYQWPLKRFFWSNEKRRVVHHWFLWNSLSVQTELRYNWGLDHFIDKYSELDVIFVWSINAAEVQLNPKSKNKVYNINEVNINLIWELLTLFIRWPQRRSLPLQWNTSGNCFL